MAVNSEFEANVLKLAAGRRDEPIFYRHFDDIRPMGAVGGHWLHTVKKVLIANGYSVHERRRRSTWTNCSCESWHTHFHRDLNRHKSDQPETRLADTSSVRSLLYTAISQLQNLYAQFPLEPTIWKRDGTRRVPYRTLVVMGLSQQVSDTLGIGVWQRFLAQYPNPDDLRRSWMQNRTEVLMIVKPLGYLTKSKQIIEAAIEFGRSIPSEKNQLTKQLGIGETIAEKIVGYGYGKPALPLDSQACRVVSRICGSKRDRNRSQYARYFREKLKNIFPRKSWMEVHELLRLHGQTVCKESDPFCSHCPVSRCHFRVTDWSRSMNPARSAGRRVIDLWEKWRQLLVSSHEVDLSAAKPSRS